MVVSDATRARSRKTRPLWPKS